MLEELQRRNYSDTTARGYIRAVAAFAQYFGKSPDQLGPDELRTYQAYLLKQRKLAVPTVVAQVAALRFFFVRTLKRDEFRQELPYPKKQRRLPTVLSLEEVGQLIDAAGNLQQRAILMILYGTGMRRCEVSALQVAHVDSGRMVIRVEDGKGGHDRDLPLSPALLETLREYWRWKKPRTYLFPAGDCRRGPNQPISDKSIWYACKEAARHAGIRKRVTPHTLRHASAYYTTFQSSFILKIIAFGRAQSAAVYGHNGRLALVPARLATRGPSDQ
jgi:integrase